jgi:hypothetical protein
MQHRAPVQGPKDLNKALYFKQALLCGGATACNSCAGALTVNMAFFVGALRSPKVATPAAATVM